MKTPKWKHPLKSPEGRQERAVWTFLDGERRGMQVVTVMRYLRERQGLSDAEIFLALDTAAVSKGAPSFLETP